MSDKSMDSFGQTVLKDQAAGIAVETINTIRIQDEIVQLAKQDAAFELAIAQIDKVREFISRPQNILGSIATKHGEIAEHVEVGIRNARQAVSQEAMTATFEGVHRTGPVDLIIDGLGVQSKFINGISNNLRHVLGHMEMYPDHTMTGGYYIIPKDTHEVIQKLLNGEHIEGLKGKTEEKLLALVAHIEEVTGKPFRDVVKSSVASYPDVQSAAVEGTLDEESGKIAATNESKKEDILLDHKPSLEEAGKAALVGAVVAGSMTLATSLYGKYRDGKNVFRGDFTEEDWREVGIESLKGAAGGAVAGGGVYLMTNYAGMAAPFASAVVSAFKGLNSLNQTYAAGEITREEFHDLGMVVCAESAFVGVSTAIGQTLIPIPILGAVVGSVAGKFMTEFVKGRDEKLAQRLREDMKAFKDKLDAVFRETLEGILAELDNLKNLTVIAFDLHLNTRLVQRSVELAKAYGVPSANLIMNDDDLDGFMTS